MDRIWFLSFSNYLKMDLGHRTQSVNLSKKFGEFRFTDLICNNRASPKRETLEKEIRIIRIRSL